MLDLGGFFSPSKVSVRPFLPDTLQMGKDSFLLASVLWQLGKEFVRFTFQFR